MTERILTEDEWDAEFAPLNDTILDLDSPIIRAVDVHHLWTEADGEGGTPIHSGLHRVNRIGYWITENAWTDDVTVIRPEEE